MENNIEYTKGNLLKKMREDLKLSQESLGKLVGCSQQAINRYESGLQTPPLERAKRLSEIFKVDKYFFLPEEWQPPYYTGITQTDFIEILQVIEAFLAQKRLGMDLIPKIELVYAIHEELQKMPQQDHLATVLHISDYLNKKSVA